ncbi:hypothetical protein L1285_09440 [Pseudoalteromonas sp. DL2-H2.2]|uniref:PKD domain-containing protein n=1 Tax=Pseudoalteromonas sp. DL2-H2.2 TaxID=2908889 RepID=UPI001F439AFF|nr:hypothetical protein [Pseudoalteromonas sp. DL2-H2.2]MCF2908548.1 hypothetical protein [Pseudoalteromonas sp. DL2-H2.2]
MCGFRGLGIAVFAMIVAGCGGGSEDSNNDNAVKDKIEAVCELSAAENVNDITKQLNTVLENLHTGSQVDGQEFYYDTKILPNHYTLGSLLTKAGKKVTSNRDAKSEEHTLSSAKIYNDTGLTYDLTKSNSTSLGDELFTAFTGVPLGLEMSDTDKKNLSAHVSIDIEYSDLKYSELDEPKEVFYQAASEHPEATKLVAGVYTAKIKSRISQSANCQGTSIEALEVSISDFLAQSSSNMAITDSSSSDSFIELTSKQDVAVAYLFHTYQPKDPKPFNVFAYTDSGPTIRLNWESNYSGLTYKVYYSQSQDFSVENAIVYEQEVNQPFAVISSADFQPGQEWWFKVEAIVADREEKFVSEHMQRVRVPTDAPSVPVTVSATPMQDGRVKIAWTQPVDNDAVTFEVMRKEADIGDYVQIKSISYDSSKESFIKGHYVDSALKKNTEYHYKVQYSNYLGASPESRSVSVTTPAEFTDGGTEVSAEAGENLYSEPGKDVYLNGTKSSTTSNLPLSYRWSAHSQNQATTELHDKDKAEPYFTIPADIRTPQTLIFVLQVSDDGNWENSDIDTVEVHVVDSSGGSENQAPTIVLDISNETPVAGETVTISALGSSDPDGDQLSYVWQDISGQLNISETYEPTLNVSIPTSASPNTKYQLLLTLSDGYNAVPKVIELNVAQTKVQGGPLIIEAAFAEAPILGQQNLLQIYVANQTSAVINNVELKLPYPAFFERLSRDYVSDGGSCGCSDGGEISWALGDLAPNSSTYVTLTPTFQLAGVQQLNLEATNGEGIKATKTELVVVSDNDATSMVLVQRSPEVLPGSKAVYDLQFAYQSNSTPIENGQVEVLLPEGLSLLSADKEVVEDGQSVKWTVGRIKPGDVGMMRLVFQVSNEVRDVSHLLPLEAFLSDEQDNSTLAQAKAVAQVIEDKKYEFALTLSDSFVVDNEFAYLEAMVMNNTNEAITGADIYLRKPIWSDTIYDEYISNSGNCGGDCNHDGEFISWTVGTLDPGQSRVFSANVPIKIWRDAQVHKLVGELELEGSAQVLASAEAGLTGLDEKLIVMDMIPSTHTVTVGDTVRYEILITYLGTSQVAENVYLEFEIPAGASYVESDGTYENGLVSWSIGRLEPGAMIRKTLHIASEHDTKRSIFGEARLYANQQVNPVIVQSSVVPVLERALPVELDLATSTHYVRPGEWVDVKLSIANNSDYERKLVNLLVRFSHYFENLASDYISYGGSCSGDCNFDGEFLIWSFNALSAHEVKTVSFRAKVKAELNEGVVIPLRAELEQGDPSQTLQFNSVFDTEALVVGKSHPELVVVANKDPVLPGELVSIAVNTILPSDAETLTAVVVDAQVPEGFTVVSATGNADIEEGSVSWHYDELLPARSSQHSIILRVDSAQAGHLHKFKTRVWSNADMLQINELNLRVDEERPMSLMLNVPETVAVNSPIDFQITITNHSDFKRNINELFAIFPEELVEMSERDIDGVDCPDSVCNSNEFISWGAMELAPGESKVFSLSGTVKAESGHERFIEFQVQAIDSAGFVVRQSATSVIN